MRFARKQSNYLDETRSFPCHRILIVDDLPPAASSSPPCCDPEGSRYAQRRAEAEALAMIEQEKPELVLSDISMPEMTGYELAQEIRRRPEWNDIRLVAVTGYGQESDKKSGEGSRLRRPSGQADQYDQP